MNYEQLKKRYDSMFPDQVLENQQRELGLTVIKPIDGKEPQDILEKIAFSLVMHFCNGLKEASLPIPEDLTDALLEAKEQLIASCKNLVRGEPLEICVKFSKKAFNLNGDLE